MRHWPKLKKDSTQVPTKVSSTKFAGVADTGASVTCAGTNLLQKLNLRTENLCPADTVIRTANLTPLSLLGMLPATIQVVGHPERKSTQVIYICTEVKEMFISNRSHKELGSLPTSWPYQVFKEEACKVNKEDSLAPCGCKIRSVSPAPPKSLSFPEVETDDCWKKLEE